jgi:hypothetical protein
MLLPKISRRGRRGEYRIGDVEFSMSFANSVCPNAPCANFLQTHLLPCHKGSHQPPMFRAPATLSLQDVSITPSDGEARATPSRQEGSTTPSLRGAAAGPFFNQHSKGAKLHLRTGVPFYPEPIDRFYPTNRYPTPDSVNRSAGWFGSSSILVSRREAKGAKGD